MKTKTNLYKVVYRAIGIDDEIVELARGRSFREAAIAVRDFLLEVYQESWADCRSITVQLLHEPENVGVVFEPVGQEQSFVLKAGHLTPIASQNNGYLLSKRARQHVGRAWKPIFAISQNRQFTKSNPQIEVIMNATTQENPSDFASQNGKAKSGKGQIVAQITRIIRKAGLDYAGWRYFAKMVRRACELRPAKRGRKLPRVLNADEFRRFYQIVDRAEDAQHSLMLRLLFLTAVRVSELCKMEIADVDLENCKIRVNQGKGSKDRYVLFGKSFATALRTHIAAHLHNRWLFQTRRATNFSTRRVEQIVKYYSDEAGVKATPHTFRHQAITWLTRHSGMADAELQLITGHARRETLAIYQHVALDGELEAKYHQSMKQVDL